MTGSGEYLYIIYTAKIDKEMEERNDIMVFIKLAVLRAEIKYILLIVAK